MLSGLKIRKYLAKQSPRMGKAAIKGFASVLAGCDEDVLAKIKYYKENFFNVVTREDKSFELNMARFELVTRQNTRAEIEKYYKAKEAYELRKRRQHPDRYFIKSLRG